MACKYCGEVKEKLFARRPEQVGEGNDICYELTREQARNISGVEDIGWIDEFDDFFNKTVYSGHYEYIWLDMQKNSFDDRPDEMGQYFSKFVVEKYPYLKLCNIYPLLREMRSIKQPCEINALRKAIEITVNAIKEMMKVSHPGIYEYELKAIYDQYNTCYGCFDYAFQPIIASGSNAFCIDYNNYTRQAQDQDMILADVSSRYDGMCSDISRSWPVNGRFTEKQKLIFEMLRDTSDYMFSQVKPGLPMHWVDETVRKLNYDKLKAMGMVNNYDEVGKYLWHGGGHHIGYDNHENIEPDSTIKADMVFCIDVGCYIPEWGFGFRIEDNLLVTQTGCENLSAIAPRSIEEIESLHVY